MVEGVIPADAARLESVAEDARQLSRLVDDLQELSIAEAGRLRYEMTEVDMCDLVRREVERAAPLARGGVLVVAECTPPVDANGDAGRLSQVLRNLLANALRHTEAGSVTVTCSIEGPWARVEVRDTGEGIPEEDLPYVFERFYRADAARARDTGGSGVGLAISKRIVADHGGFVFAENMPRGGSAVGFCVPARSGGTND
jgi:two-component system sensor histidine kinase BaeS